MRLQVNVKRSGATSILISLSILLVMSLFYLAFRQVIYNELHQRAVGVAMAVAAGIDPQDVESIHIKEDVGKAGYRKILVFIRHLSRSNAEVQRVYILRRFFTQDKNRVNFAYVVDDTVRDENNNGLIEADEVGKPPGTHYEKSTNMLCQAWQHPCSEVALNLWRHRWDSIIGYAPVKNEQGETVAVVGINITSESLSKRLVRLQIVIVMVWVFLSLLALFFPGITKKRWIGYVLVSLIIFVLFGFLYLIARRVIINEIRYHAMGVAIATAAAISPDDVESIDGREDVHSEAYKRIQEFMARIADTNVDVRYIYVMRRPPRPEEFLRTFEYVVDEATTDHNGNGVIEPDEVGNLPGTRYDASCFPEMAKAWYQPAADYDTSPDPPYPDLMSGYAPVKDRTGQTVALVGVDVTAGVVSKKLLAVRTVIFIVWLTLSLLVMAVLQLYFQKRELVQERENLIDELKESRQRFIDLSITDELTSLYNSRQFYLQLESEMGRSERYRRPLSLLLLDLDDFKIFNDTFGHLAGDQLLKEFAQTLRENIRQSDTACRYGGEEFSVILPETDQGHAKTVADKIRNTIKERFIRPDGDNTNHSITVSIGIATYRLKEETKAFINRADTNLYEAKRQGKNRVHYA